MHDGDKATNKTSTARGEPIFPVKNVSFRPSIFILIFTQSKAPSETSKTEYGSVQDQEDKVPENFSDEEISDASSNDKP